jgi:hypothetical protein
MVMSLRFYKLLAQSEGDEIKDDEVGGTCDTHGGGERCLQGFGWEARR